MSSFIENGSASEIHQSPSHNSMHLSHGGGAMYAPPPVTMLPPPPPNSSETTASLPYKAEGVSSGGNVAAAATDVVNQGVVDEHNDKERNDAANNNSGEVIKRKRGRPRKYAPTDASMSSPTLQSPAAEVVAQGSSGKRGRGRPPGSVNKPKAKAVATFPVSPAVSGSAGVGFTPHVVTVGTGEDVLARIMSFSQLNIQAVCVLSANGTISNVTIRQPSSSGGTVSYQGHFEILSLSGSFLLSESSGRLSRTGGLSVSLAGPDGRVFGGGVTGLLTAASPVQVIVGTFMGTSQQVTRLGYEVFTAPKRVSATSVGGSPPSRATLSEFSGGPGSPLNHSTGGCNNTNQQTIPNVAWT